VRVLHVYRTYFPDTQGGSEEAIRQICLNSSSFGIEHRVFSLSRHPEPAILERPEAQVHRFPLSFEIASCGFSPLCLQGFKRLVDWADVVHYNFPWPYADMLHFMARVRKPTVITYQSDIVRQQGLLKLYQPLMHRFLTAADQLVATTPNYVESSPVLQRYRDKISIIPIGLNRESYPAVPPAMHQQVAERFGGDYFLFVGVLRYYKGLHLLLQAAQGAPFQVVIAGNGPTEAALKAQAQHLGLDNVHFVGFVSDEMKMALYQQARAVVFPSHLRSEAFGVTLVEGAMCGKPLISAEIGSGMSYINRHDQTGLVVEPSSPQALRAALLQLHASPELAQQMGEAALARYEKLFTGQRMGALYAHVFSRLATES
jgi:rhamnosyl/mannosyltransferase